MKIEELRIPAPWGHIAVKAWNDDSSKAILVVHGYMDNAGSFDKLIPLLPKNFYYICFDLPGHGLSDHFHKGALLTTLDHLLAFKILVDYFKRNKYMIIGHSYGAQLSILFCQLYPEHVTKLVSLDAIAFKPVDFFESLENGMNLFFANMEPDRKKAYPYAECVEKIKKARVLGKLDLESAENIAKRLLEKRGQDEFVFRSDIRLKELLNPPWDLSYVKDTHLKFPIKCQCLFIFFNDSHFPRMFKLVYEHFKERNFEIHHIDGHHDYHTSNPEVIVNIITEFLLRKTKL